ncbi:MAG TPA: gliding motility-associated C-terminal domain-containing protein, partial [Chitinophagales bacterium]|nr:gliding motility-associated C-terminal domain-containing protein [Chitinophagales bacterium]
RSDCDLGIAGNGGKGGDGGRGGNGGDGQAGLSRNIQLDGGQPLAASGINFNLDSQPVIFAENVSCTNRPVGIASANSSNWNLGTGANPLSAAGANVNPFYTNTGRKNITYGSDGYTGFVNIVIDSAAFRPAIKSSARLISAGTYLLCAGERADFTTNTPAVNYDWNFGGAVVPDNYTTRNVAGLVFGISGTFIITLRVYTDCCGWSVADSVTLIVEPLASITVSGDTALCPGETTTLTLSGAASYSFVPLYPAVSGPEATITLSPDSTSDYLVIGYSTSGICTTMVPVAITVNERPAVTTTAAPATCIHDGSATATVTGGSGSFSFQWDDTDSQTTRTAVNLFSGSYSVTVTDNISGCLAEALAFVPAAGPVAFIQNTTDISCYGGNDGTATAAGAGGTQPYSFLWSNGGQGATISGVIAGEYTVTLTDNAGCASVATAYVAQPDSMVVAAMVLDSNYCHDDLQGKIFAVADGGNGGYSYEWFSDSTLVSLVEDNDTAGDLASGVFFVLATDRNGCTARNTAIIPAARMPYILDTILINPSCFGYSDGEITLLVSDPPGNYSFEWNIPSITDSIASGLHAGDYTVKISDDSGCDTLMTITLTEPPPASVRISPHDTTVKQGQSVQLSSVYTSSVPAGSLAYSWFPFESLDCDTCRNAIATPPASTTYTLTVTDQNGCRADASATINVELDKSLWVPNAFSPNDDDVNDVFYVYGNGIKSILFIVANRWGEKLFESRDVSVGWDGTYRGKRLNPGVYAYYVEATFLDGDRKAGKGSVMLIR